MIKLIETPGSTRVFQTETSTMGYTNPADHTEPANPSIIINLPFAKADVEIILQDGKLKDILNAELEALAMVIQLRIAIELSGSLQFAEELDELAEITVSRRIQIGEMLNA